MTASPFPVVAVPKRILIICFDVPYPDNYGGVKDVWSRVQYLRAAGYDLDLLASCGDQSRVAAFRDEETRSRNFGQTVIVPWRLDWSALLFRAAPISMAIRGVGAADGRDLHRLFDKSYDIVLVEHLKSLGLFASVRPRLRASVAYFRSHNIESEFYRLLAKSEPLGRKWLFLRLEAILYRLWERRLAVSKWFEKILYISRTDLQRDVSFREAHKIWLPMWAGPDTAVGSTAFEERHHAFLYVGNLDSADNIKSVWQICRLIEPLLQEGMTFIVAGKRAKDTGIPLPDLQGVHYRFNVSPDELRATYESSKVFLAYSLNEAGVKTKLIDALMHAMPVVANRAGVTGSGFEDVILQVDGTTADSHAELVFLRQLVQSRDAWESYLDRQQGAVATFVAEVRASYQNAFAA